MLLVVQLVGSNFSLGQPTQVNLAVVVVVVAVAQLVSHGVTIQALFRHVFIRQDVTLREVVILLVRQFVLLCEHKSAVTKSITSKNDTTPLEVVPFLLYYQRNDITYVPVI